MGISSSSDEKKAPNAQNGNKPVASNSVVIRQGREKSAMDNTLFMGTPLENPLPLTSPVKIQISNSNYGERQDSDNDLSDDNREKKALPTVFSWKHGGKSIYLSGSFNKWKERIPMQESHGDFTVIQSLPPGVYYYRFIVDGKWQTDPGLPMVTDANGEVNNIIEIKNQNQDSSSLLHGGNVNNTPPGSYGQEEKLLLPPPKTTSKGTNSSTPSNNSPPSLPPHLLRALLNTSPPSKLDPSLLPLPHHVMLNHFYSLPRPEDDIVILGVTQRYKTKFVTTVFYKPLPPVVEDDFASDGLSHVSFLSGE